ncbi:MAG: 3-methyl-2-oxobutanoate hydroxymethyltransferase [Micrococcales bacterium]
MTLTPKVVRTSTLADFKRDGRKFSCLTSYDHLTAGIFDEAGIEVLLVGDSAADNALGYKSTLPLTVDEMIPFGKAVSSAATRALVVIDLPFGSYEAGPDLALQTATRFMKESGAAAVKLEGGVRSADQIRAVTQAGIPVMGHVGFTPQSVNNLGGFKVQGRGEGAEQLRADALAVQEAGAFAVVFEMVPAEIAAAITAELTIPTIGIGAGHGCDGQILVWTDFAGLTGSRPRKFVKQYASLRDVLLRAATEYREDVASGAFPTSEHEFE